MTDQLTPEQQLDAAYRERAHLVAWLAAHYPSVIAPASDVDEPGWQIVYLTADGCQLSWHIAPRDAALFAHVEHVPADDPRARWDGHTTDEKYERIRQHTTGLAQGCGRECAEGHTYTGRCELTEPDNPAAYALARHIADHPISTVQAAFRYLNAPLTLTVHEVPADGCPGSETEPNLCTCDCEGCKHNCAAHQPTAPTVADNQLAAVRSWLAAEALKIRHRLPHMRVPEVWRSMDGMAHGLDYAARIIDRYATAGRLPVTGGAECDCADPETQHRATGAAVRDTELARLRAQVAAARSFAEELRGYCSWQGISAMYADRLDARLDAALDGTPTEEAERG